MFRPPKVSDRRRNPKKFAPPSFRTTMNHFNPRQRSGRNVDYDFDTDDMYSTRSAVERRSYADDLIGSGSEELGPCCSSSRRCPCLSPAKSICSDFPIHPRRDDKRHRRGGQADDRRSHRNFRQAAGVYSLSPCVDESEALDDEDVRLTRVKYPDFMVKNSFLSTADSIRLWDLVSKFIEHRFERRQGVNLPNLGTLTILSNKFQIGHNIYQHDMKPVFLVTGKLARLHRLQRPTVRTSSDIPTLQLNFSTIAQLLAIPRGNVELAYYETMEKISNLMRIGKKTVVPLRGIGHLVFHLETVKMRFAPSFRKRFEKNVREKGHCEVRYRPFIP